MTRSGPIRGIFLDPSGSGRAEIRSLPDRSEKVLRTLLNTDKLRITTVEIEGALYDIHHQWATPQ